ncbi:MAG: hypothetical protein JWN93_3437 [Hyphomicrobiales bacterium]|nr:hypothetical protein [Hyphomicrobiales bacterium]
MNGLFWADGPAAPWSFLFVTVVLGGLAAFAAGRAVAQTWRPFAQVFAYVALLALAVGFLHYALFAEAAIPMARIAGAVARLPQSPGLALAELAGLLRFYAVIALVLAGIASLGFSRTRARQMARQYGFEAPPAP